jgi:hypothetical protein
MIVRVKARIANFSAALSCQTQAEFVKVKKSDSEVHKSMKNLQTKSHQSFADKMEDAKFCPCGRHLLCVIVAALLLTGCVTRTPINIPPPQIVSIPEPGALVEKELGETVVMKAKIYTLRGLTLNNQISAGYLFARPGFYREALEDEGWTYYEKWGNYYLGLSKTNHQDLKLVGFARIATYRHSPKPAPDFQLSTETDLRSDSFQQELIYNGKSGNILKFLYRESSGDTLRYPFNQDIQYDLTDGKIIGFKGARLEIVEASNTKLKYKLISNFPAKGGASDIPSL